MKALIPTELSKRISDKWGAGHFGAPRGNHTHHGIDYQCPAGSEVLSPCEGEVTKLGYAYPDDLSFRYVQITSDGKDHRIFYVEPSVFIGDAISVDQVIGTAQDLTDRYPDITPHVHHEIKVGDEYIDPEESI